VWSCCIAEKEGAGSSELPMCMRSAGNVGVSLRSGKVRCDEIKVRTKGETKLIHTYI
jgi:hypothetical protein